MELVFGIILLVAAVFLVIAVLMQSGKSHNLSGAIAGGADTFFGKNKGKKADKILNRLTSIVAVVFAVLVIITYVIQPNTIIDPDKYLEDYMSSGDNNKDTEAPETEPSTDAVTDDSVTSDDANDSETAEDTDAETAADTDAETVADTEETAVDTDTEAVDNTVEDTDGPEK